MLAGRGLCIKLNSSGRECTSIGTIPHGLQEQVTKYLLVKLWNEKINGVFFVYLGQVIVRIDAFQIMNKKFFKA